MLTIIGCGNANRRDDAVGVLVAQRLCERLAKHPVPGVQALDCGTAGMEVLYAARDSEKVILIDAVVSGAEPGAVFEVPATQLVSERERGLTLHDFRWDDALHVGARIYGPEFPERVDVFLVEAADTALGVALSPEVQAAADTVFSQILERMAVYAVARHSPDERWEVVLDGGWVRIPRTLYDRVFEGREGVVPFVLEDAVCLMPVEQIAGGLLVKIRNARGDRTVDASEVLRGHGWDVQGTYTCTARWEGSLGALALTHPEAS